MEEITQSNFAETDVQEEAAIASESADSELIYGLEDRPPLRDTIFAAVQHVLACFVES